MNKIKHAEQKLTSILNRKQHNKNIIYLNIYNRIKNNINVYQIIEKKIKSIYLIINQKKFYI